MKKIKFLFIALAITFSLNLVMPVIYAEDEIKDNNDNIISEDKEKEEILKLIDAYLEEINEKIDLMDKNIANSKEQKEFEYYPAIRLNIDTPMFGLTSVVENKLRVKRDISTSDVASQYSIRDIVSNRKIRLPDSYLASIVMTTKEIDIDSSMTLPQAKITLAKCIQYLSQVNSVDDYINTQTNNIFRDYISNDKKNNIRDIKDRVRKVSNELVGISDKIRILSFLGIDVNEQYNKYLELTKDLYNIKNGTKNTLILDSDLNTLTRNSLTNESNVIDLNSNVTALYESSLEDIDYKLFLENIVKNYESKISTINSYIESSKKVTKKIEDGKEEKITTVNYEVTSIATLDYLKTVLEDVNKELTELKKNNLDESNQEKVEDSEENKEEKTKEELKQEKAQKIEDNSKKVNIEYNKYKEVLSREYKFYTSNINMLLKNSNDKISAVIAEINSGIDIDNDIFGYTKYIYIDLPENLEKYIDENNIDSIIELENLISLLKKEIIDLSNKNMKITKIYNKILEEALKS